MRYRLETLFLQISHHLDDLVPQIDGVHSLVAALDSRRLSPDENLEPDASDTAGLNRVFTCLAAYSRVRRITAQYGVQRSVAA